MISPSARMGSKASTAASHAGRVVTTTRESAMEIAANTPARQSIQSTDSFFAGKSNALSSTSASSSLGNALKRAADDALAKAPTKVTKAAPKTALSVLHPYGLRANNMISDLNKLQKFLISSNSKPWYASATQHFQTAYGSAKEFQELAKKAQYVTDSSKFAEFEKLAQQQVKHTEDFLRKSIDEIILANKKEVISLGKKVESLKMNALETVPFYKPELQTAFKELFAKVGEEPQMLVSSSWGKAAAMRTPVGYLEMASSMHDKLKKGVESLEYLLKKAPREQRLAAVREGEGGRYF